MPDEELQAANYFSRQRALISTSDKSLLVPFAKTLYQLGFELLSTGNTAAYLKQHDIPVTLVADYTGFPEMMQGRVKTLHPKIHGGLLGRIELDEQAMQQHGIPPIQLLIVNLYPFQETIAKPDCTLEQAIEQIDIGGPAMIRSAAKNHQQTTVLVDSSDYATVLEKLQRDHDIDKATRHYLAQKAFAYTAQYDAAIANYLQAHDRKELFPDTYLPCFHKQETLRYGENPHQQAAFYVEAKAANNSMAQTRQLQGKQLSFNNIADANAAWHCVQEFQQEHACVIVKHTNPCGVALSHTQHDAYQRAFKTDPNSSFGGILAFNQQLTVDTAQTIIKQQFAEVIIAPEFSEQVLSLLQQKPNIRVLQCPNIEQKTAHKNFDYKRVSGGLLVQQVDQQEIQIQDWKTVTDQQANEEQLADLLFAWKAVKHVKSNAIVYAKQQCTLGIGAGQTSRIDSTRIAAMKAEQHGHSLDDAVMASDAFLPFADNVEFAAKLGIRAIIQPGGSIRDDEVITAANKADMIMLFTGTRHFCH